MKYLTVGLLLIVFFFGGMTYGTVETNHSQVQDELETEEETLQMDPFVKEELQPEKADIEANESILYQIASGLEKIVLSVYTSFISMLYNIADLFF